MYSLRQKPLRCKLGSSIGIISPSGPISDIHKVRFEKGIETLRIMGFHTILYDHVYDQLGYLAGDDQIRIKDIEQAFLDNSTQAVAGSRGGYGLLRLLSLLKPQFFLPIPKIFFGFSDLIILSHYLYRHCKIPSLHAPVITQLSEVSVKSRETLVKLMNGEKVSFQAENSYGNENHAEGTILGGCLSVFVSMLDTGILSENENIILFLEDTNEPYYKIDRMIQQLRLSKIYKNIKSIVLGTFDHCSGDRLSSAGDSSNHVLELLSDFSGPILTGMKFGHEGDNIPFPLGIQARVNTKEKTCIMLESVCREL